MTTEPYTPDTARWGAFIEWARRFYEWEDFEKAERNYKLEAGKELAAARESFLEDGPDWRSKLHDVANQPYLLVWRMTAAYRRFLESNESGSADALLSIWETGAATPQDRIRTFADTMEAVGADIRGYDNLGSFLLMALDARLHPYYQYTPFNAAYQMTDYPRVNIRWAPDAKYGHALAFLDEFVRQAGNRGLEVRDRLERVFV